RSGVAAVVHTSMVIVLMDLRDALSRNVTCHLTSYWSVSKPLMFRLRPVGSASSIELAILSLQAVPWSSSADFFVGGFPATPGQDYNEHSTTFLPLGSTSHASLRS